MGRNKYKIVDSAIELLRDKGFEAMTIDDILSRSGVQKSNFYYHFPNKDECVLAAIDRMLELVDEEVWQSVLMNKTFSPTERLEKLVEHLSGYFEGGQGRVGDVFGNLAAEISDHLPRFQEKLNDYFIRYASYIEGVIAEGIDEEEFSKSLIPREVAECFLAVMQGAFILSRAFQEPGVFRRNMNFILNLISS